MVLSIIYTIKGINYSPDQTCAIRGRSILDNGHLHRNIIDYCNQKNLKCAFISFDREKAFDRISHKFFEPDVPVLSSAKAEILHEIFDPGNCMTLISRSK
jgi:hypothetical protein